MARSTTGNTYHPDDNPTGRTVGLSVVVVVVLLVGVVAAGTWLLRDHFNGSPGEITYEVTGEPGATADVTRRLPARDDDSAKTLANQALPFMNQALVGPGTFEVRATPSRGALTCRIVVDGKEKAKKTGTPGQPVRCVAEVHSR